MNSKTNNQPTEIILKIQTDSSNQELITDKQKSVSEKPVKENLESKEQVKTEEVIQSEQLGEGENDISDLIPQGDYRISPLFYEVANYFRIIPEQYEDTKHKISYIIDWAILTKKSNKISSILKLLSETDQEIPQPQYGMGETKLANFYKTLRLAERRETTKKMWDSYEEKSNIEKGEYA